MPKHPEHQIHRSRMLRNGQTDVEQRLWHLLRNRQLDGFKFRRQHGIGGYIVDFACIEARLVVELDGGQHAEQANYDERRTANLNAAGYRVLRFWSNEALENTGGVLERIRSELLQSAPHPSPLPSGERE